MLVTLGGATDPDGDALTYAITGVTQDEPVSGLGEGDKAPDAKPGPSSGSVYLRAERRGRGRGRLYFIAFTVSDGHGGSCTGTVTVGVPHDQKHRILDTGKRFNSFVVPAHKHGRRHGHGHGHGHGTHGKKH
jgi:hypothetical protein